MLAQNVHENPRKTRPKNVPSEWPVAIQTEGGSRTCVAASCPAPCGKFNLIFVFNIPEFGFDLGKPSKIKVVILMTRGGVYSIFGKLQIQLTRGGL